MRLLSPRGPAPGRHPALLSAAALIALLGWAGPAFAPPAFAQTAGHGVANPSEVEIRRPSLSELPATGTGTGTGREPVLQVIPGKEALLTLDVAYSDPEVTRIFNPSTDSYDKVKLRTYNGRLVAPTVRIHPGETVRATLTNHLPATAPCPNPQSAPGGCQNFNVTNLHGHGLWVSPQGNSDNVLQAINPTVSFQYEYNIPADHPSGLYWYHPHIHGSTALQTAGGMGGALIVEGNRPPGPDGRGDIDTILRDEQGRPFKERVILLQQIQYACRDAQGQIKTKTVEQNGSQTVVAWVCDPGDVGGVENYDQFGPTSWQQSNRYTTINGEVQPDFTEAEAGRIERWRLVHAGVRDTINLAFIKVKDGAQPYRRGMGPAQQYWIAENCPDPTQGQDRALVQWEFAADGQTEKQFIALQTNVLQPGYRSDLLVVFPEKGDYCVVDRGAAVQSTVNGQVKTDRLLGFVRVAGGKPTAGDGKAVIQQALSQAAGRLPADIREAVRKDLADGLKIGLFTFHKPVADAEVAGRQPQEMLFSLAQAEEKGPVTFNVNHKPFNPSDPPRELTLGKADEWILSAANELRDPGLTSLVISHPFHIHINPFEVVKILDPQGRDVTDPAIPRATRLEWEGNDPQYLDMKGMWRDTLFVKQDYKLIVRTRYERYIGDFVLHCHILDHEDQGMMQLVKVSVPAGEGGSAHGHSH